MAVVQSLIADPSAAYEVTVIAQEPLRTTIRAAGELDLAARGDLDRLLRRHQGAQGHIVQVDLSRVTFFDCSCLGAFIAAHDRLRKIGGLLVLTGVSGAVARVVALTGLADVLVMVPADPDPFGSIASRALARRRAASKLPDPGMKMRIP